MSLHVFISAEPRGPPPRAMQAADVFVTTLSRCLLMMRMTMTQAGRELNHQPASRGSQLVMTQHQSGSDYHPDRHSAAMVGQYYDDRIDPRVRIDLPAVDRMPAVGAPGCRRRHRAEGAAPAA